MTTPSVLITPSILSANFAILQEEVKSIEPYADWIQADVMDGHFVSNLSFGAPVLRWIETRLPLDVHLMVTNPAARIAEFLAIGAKHITFHAETVEETAEREAIITDIRRGGATAGIAINPETPVSFIDDILHEIDLVLVMSVHPGFSNQTFMESVLPKVRELRTRFPALMIQMDGGIDASTAVLCREAGANNLVSASYIFRSSDRAKAISSLRGS